MRKTLKWILGSFLTIVIVISGGFASWFFFFRQQPLEYPRLPDLTLSNYSLEDDILILTITNVGNASTPSVTAIVSINTTNPAGNVLYNNFENPEFLDQNEDFIITLNLLDFREYFVSETNYLIAVQIDLSDNVDEISEDNNEFLIRYYYEGEVTPPFGLFSPNTYSLNCSINNFSYAAQFNASEILLEDSLNITDGKINGYSLLNSSISENCTITNDIYQINVVLYGNQIITIRNIWDARLNIVLSDSSSISLYNSSIQNLFIGGSNDIYLWNSSIFMLTTSQNQMNLGTLRIENISKIEIFILSIPMFVEIEYSSIKSFYVLVSQNLYSEGGDYLVSGSIRNCTIHNFLAYGQTKLDIFCTEIYQLSVIGKTRLNLVECIITEGSVLQNSVSIFNQSKVLSELSYGIKISYGSANLTNGVIEGTNYLNTTILIDSNVSKMVLNSIVVNNTAQVFVSNFSSIFFLYDDASLVVNDTNIDIPNQYSGYLEGSSRITGINATFNTVLSQQNSSLYLSGGSLVDALFVNNTNTVNIKNCIFNEISWNSDMQGPYNAKIINSTIKTFYATFPSKLDIINCSIDMLYEGIEFQSGINYLNSSGYFGDGVVLNSINITDSMISSRTYKYININGATQIKFNDLHDYISISTESGNATITNCTIDSLQMKDNAVVHLNNCSTSDFGGFGSLLSMLLGPQAFICKDNSTLHINNSIIYDGFILVLIGSAQTTIEFSSLYGIYIYEHSRAEITSSEFWVINVSSSYIGDYALNISYSSIEILSTTGWKYN